LHFLIKCLRFDWSVDLIKRVHRLFDVDFVDIVEERFDSVLVSVIVQDDETYATGGDERRDEPLVEFVDSFQIHCVRAPHEFIDEIERRVSDKLIEMSVILTLRVRLSTEYVSFVVSVYESIISFTSSRISLQHRLQLSS